VKNEKWQRNVSILRTDGSQIVVLEMNGREDGNFGADRADLPLTAQQLYTIAQDPRWGATMDAAFVHAASTIQVSPNPF